MSEFFKDNVYSGMSETEEGWLTLAMEPFVFAENERISQIESVNEFDFEDIKDHITTGSRPELYKSELINMAIKRAGFKDMTHYDIPNCSTLFAVEIPEDTIIDFDNQVMSNQITLRKTKPQFDDDDIHKMMTERGVNILNGGRRYPSAGCVGRQNEILDLLGGVAKRTRSNRSARKKGWAITDHWRRILKEDEWMLRDYELAGKAAYWIRSYVEDGNLSALANFTKLKCMTHKKNPIYSMDEIK